MYRMWTKLKGITKKKTKTKNNAVKKVLVVLETVSTLITVLNKEQKKAKTVFLSIFCII